MTQTPRASIEYFPGWIWVYRQDNEQWSYVTQNGETRYSTERHGKNLLTGEVMSVGSIQRVQRNIRAGAMRPIPAERNIGTAYPTITESAMHVEKSVLVYNNLEEARIGLQFNGDWERYTPRSKHAYISIYYSKKLERPQGTDTALPVNGYAVLTGYYRKEEMISTMEPWEIAQELQQYYEMGPYSRVLINGIIE